MNITTEVQLRKLAEAATPGPWSWEHPAAVNPAEINGGADELVACAAMTPVELKAHWQMCMRKDIAMLMTCDGIALLPGWDRSKGACLEKHNAVELGMVIALAAELTDPLPSVESLISQVPA